MTPPSRSLVLRKLRQLFPEESLGQGVLELLDSYGREAYELEQERVQLAILKLSVGDLEELRRYVRAAKADYRDVLAWAEYPEQSRAGAASPNSSPASLRELRERDRQQYLEWLRQ